MSELSEFRQSKDEFFAGGHDSPLTHHQAIDFKGLKYFDDNPDLRFVADPETFESQEVVEMQTSTGDVAQYIRWGRVSFEVEHQKAQLTLMKDEDGGGFFLPFADATSGQETYGAGRYLDVRELPDGKLLIDFNYAYNPYCAYNESWSCPLTPSENRLKVAVRAGEMSFN
jgi:uncharacterized protein (DUF1684 family)